MREAADIFKGRYVLLVSDDKERTQLLFRALQKCEAKVGIRRSPSAAPAAGTEVVLVDVRHGPLKDAEQALAADPQIRLASVCAVDFRSVVTERGSVRLGLLEEMVLPLVARDRALTEQAQREPSFSYELASLGPVRVLRALSRSGVTLSVSIEVPDAVPIHGTLTLAGDLVISAYLESTGWCEQAFRALARVLELRRGRLSIARITHPPVMNIMEPLDVALAHALQVSSAAPVPRESAPPACATTEPVPCDGAPSDELPVLLVRKRPAQPARDADATRQVVSREIIVAYEPSSEREDTQLVLSRELSLDASETVIDDHELVALEPSGANVQAATQTVPPTPPRKEATSIPDSRFAGPRSDTQLPAATQRAPRKRRMVALAIASGLMLGLLAGGGRYLFERHTIAAAAVEPLPVVRDDARAAAASASSADDLAADPVRPQTPPAIEPAAAVPEAGAEAAHDEPSSAAGDEAAASEVDRLIATASSSKELVDAASKTLARDPEAAKRLFEAAVALDARNPHALAGLGQALLALTQPSEARKALESAVRLRSKRASYRVLLGDALRMGGMIDDALESWHAALELDPDDEAARERLAAFGED